MKSTLASIAILLAACVPALAQNTVTFDNQSGEPALVKLAGPTSSEIEVPNGTKQGVQASAGRYLIKVRYGTAGKYHYAKGEEFEVKETATIRSEITITLHKVVAGNYESSPISAEEFGKGCKETKIRAQPEKNPESVGKETAKLKRPNWWITGLSITKSEVVVTIKLAICSNDKALIDSLSKESWEIKSVPENTVGVMVWNPIASIDDAGPPLPKKMITIIGRVASEKPEAILATSIRLKGEPDWVRLSNVIRIEGNKYSLCRCSRCGADYKPEAWKCVGCGAQFSAPK